MEEVLPPIEGLWNESTLISIKTELLTMESEFLVPYKVHNYRLPQYSRIFFFIRHLDNRGWIELKRINDPRYIPLQDFIARKWNDLQMETRIQIIAQIWLAFQTVITSITQYSYNVKLFCLHPSNVLIYYDDTNPSKKIIKIKFDKYIPEIFYEDIITKQNLEKNQYRNIGEDWSYISPRFLNLNQNARFNNIKGLFKGAQNVDFKDSFYSIGCLFAELIFGYNLIETIGLGEILNHYQNDWEKIIVVPSFETNIVMEQFIRMLLSLRTPMKKIIDSSSYLTHAVVNNEIDTNNLIYQNQISEGSFGKLFKCIYNNNNGERIVVAAKELELKVNGLKYDQVYTEYEMMTRCNSTNFINVKGIAYSRRSINPENNTNGRYVYIIMEYADLGSLESFIKKRWPHGLIPKEFVEHVFIETLYGLWFLHSHRCIVHRDIKPANILVLTNEQNPKCPFIKICDLGQAKVIMCEDESPKTFAGTSPYMAPEFKSVGESYTYKIDLWSFAVTMYQLVTYNMVLGVKPTKSNVCCSYQIDINFNESVWSEYNGMKNVLEHLFIYNYEDRWGWPELFRDDYIQGLLLQRKKRMIQEMNPGRVISDEEARNMLNEENNARIFFYQNLYKIAYKL